MRAHQETIRELCGCLLDAETGEVVATCERCKPKADRFVVEIYDAAGAVRRKYGMRTESGCDGMAREVLLGDFSAFEVVARDQQPERGQAWRTIRYRRTGAQAIERTLLGPELDS